VNTWQVLKQIQYFLRLRNWPGSSSKVFAKNSVIISTAAPDEIVVGERIAPYAVLVPLAATTDEDEPGLIRQTIAVRIGAYAEDQLGETSLVGGHRISVNASPGRGVLEIESEVFATIGQLTEQYGVWIQSRQSSAAAGEFAQNAGKYCTWREYQFECVTTEAKYYPPPIDPYYSGKVVIGGVPTYYIDWINPPGRWDLYCNVLRYKAGITPPSSPTDGLPGTLPSLLHNRGSIINPASGTYSVSVFSAYDETNDPPSVAQIYSDQCARASCKFTVP
jgi:hypothetical protein